MSYPRILFVQPVLPSYRVPLFAGLAKRGFDVTCWSDHHPQGSLKHVDPNGLFGASHRRETALGPFISQPGLLEATRSAQFDAVILPWNVRYLELGPAVAWARAKSLPCLLWGHARSRREHSAIRFLRNAIGRAATACITYDKEARLELLREGFDPTRTFTAQNALDDQRSREAERYWREHADELTKFRTSHELHARSIVLYLSRLEPEKRIDRLLRSFSEVARIFPGAHLVIIGDGPERARLGALATSLGLEKHVYFSGSIHDELSLAAWFSSAKVLAYPTSIGLSILHAFGYGVPVITSDGPKEHSPEFFALRPNENGLTYRSGDESHFAEQILLVLRDSALRARLSAGARNTIEAEGGFNLKTMLDGMEAALRFALGTTGRPASQP